MKRLLVVFTGGTIASGFGAVGKEPVTTASSQLKASLHSLFAERGVEAVFAEPLGNPGLDSSQLDPGHWLVISRAIARAMEEGLSGVLVLHGTDTMAETAAWLSLCYDGLPIPVVLTGSQLTLDYMPEDVTSNLRGAAQACCSDLRGVWIYFNWKLIPGDRAHKSHAMHPDAFSAVNGQPTFFNPDWGLVTGSQEGSVVRRGILPAEVEKVLSVPDEEARRLARSVRWALAMPGALTVLAGDENIVCIVGYGTGNAPTAMQDELRRVFPDKHKPLVIACSQAEGGVKHPGSYAEVGIAALARSGFSVWSQMDRTLEFVHALSCYSLFASLSDPGAVLGRYLRQCQA